MTPAADIEAVVFNLGGEIFALPVGSVREILDYRDAFQMPQGPRWLAGLIDVRGDAIPMIDLRVRLGLPAATIDPMTRILVVSVQCDERLLTLGVIVDRVLDVATFKADAIETTPDIGVRWRSDYIDGIVRSGGGFVVLLAPARIFEAEDGAIDFSAFAAAA
ncbi:chemotaxis protein CheW [Sphingomonas sp. CFBP 13720]|uniref:chemotaxis protein CheW n=1 Tax=Sphingomonas sp. CFBP 13720 TaxID=2775302 RepID=UPI00177EFA61|nr:chemotaxis protein CheW [Sphingomonas sp. CFBP 13720]MBD8678953.1 chemotaxis protein CheW [Sphingomonas sp. CFBP 13720]